MSNQGQNGHTGISIKATYFVLNFLIALFKPIVVIDGYEQQGTWNSQMWFPVAPGDHQVSLYWKYFGFLPIGRSTQVVRVVPGQPTYVTYNVGFLWFLPGTMTVQGAQQAAA